MPCRGPENWRHPKQWPPERRGETDMRLIAERRILVYVGVMMGGVALATIHHDLLASPAIAGTIAGIIAVAFTAAVDDSSFMSSLSVIESAA